MEYNVWVDDLSPAPTHSTCFPSLSAMQRRSSWFFLFVFCWTFAIFFGIDDCREGPSDFLVSTDLCWLFICSWFSVWTKRKWLALLHSCSSRWGYKRTYLFIKSQTVNDGPIPVDVVHMAPSFVVYWHTAVAIPEQWGFASFHMFS